MAICVTFFFLTVTLSCRYWDLPFAFVTSSLSFLSVAVIQTSWRGNLGNGGKRGAETRDRALWMILVTMMRTLTMKAGSRCRFSQHLVSPSMNLSLAINLTPSSPIDASLMTSAGQPNHCAVSFFSTTISSPSLNISLSSLENISPSVILTPPRRKKHRTAFPRRGKKFLDIQEALRKADGIPEGAELIFLRRRDWSVQYCS